MSKDHNHLLAVGKRLKKERLKLGLTQEALSKLTNKSRIQIVNYEKARCEMTSGFLARLHPIGFDVQYLVTGVYSTSLTAVNHPTQQKEQVMPQQSAKHSSVNQGEVQ